MVIFSLRRRGRAGPAHAAPAGNPRVRFRPQKLYETRRPAPETHPVVEVRARLVLGVAEQPEETLLLISIRRRRSQPGFPGSAVIGREVGIVSSGSGRSGSRTRRRAGRGAGAPRRGCRSKCLLAAHHRQRLAEDGRGRLAEQRRGDVELGPVDPAHIAERGSSGRRRSGSRAGPTAGVSTSVVVPSRWPPGPATVSSVGRS